MIKCKRCNCRIDKAKSAFCVIADNDNGNLVARIARSSNAKSGDVAIHVNGDRECGKEVAGYRKMLLEALEIKGECDISFLDNL